MKIQRLISLILTLCLFVTSTLPVTISADPLNVAGVGGSNSGSGGGVQGNSSIDRSSGGYRFTLLYLSRNTSSGEDIVDRAGNVNIDLWSTYSEDIQCLGTLDVYWDGMDSQSNRYFDGSAYHFDMKKSKDRAKSYITNPNSDPRKMISVSELKKRGIDYGYIKDNTFDFSWQINGSKGKANISEILGELAKDENGNNIEIGQDLYPTEKKNVYKGVKYIPTPECATIITTLCQMNIKDLDVKCQSVIGEDKISPSDNVFEQGKYKGQEGSYRLLVEPYEVCRPNGGASTVMTLRDSLWFSSTQTGGKWGGTFANDIGGDLSLMANACYMVDKDIFGLNNHIPYQDVEYLSQLTKLSLFDWEGKDSNRIRMQELYDNVVKYKYGYGIGSFTSDMCKTKIQDMFIGSISNVFLPGTLQDGTGLNTDVKSYSIEYRGDKQSQDKLKDYQTELVKSLKTSIEGEISRDVTTAEEIIENNQLSSLDDSTYKNLLENVQKQLEESYPVTIYGNSVKAVTTDIFENSSFKTFITSMYNQIITQSHTGSDGTVLMDTVFFMLF